VGRARREAKGGGAVAGEEAEPPAMFVDALTVKRKRLGILTLEKSGRQKRRNHGGSLDLRWGKKKRRRDSTNQRNRAIRSSKRSSLFPASAINQHKH
jgi:hypothetical protein